MPDHQDRTGKDWYKGPGSQTLTLLESAFRTALEVDNSGCCGYKKKNRGKKRRIIGGKVQCVSLRKPPLWADLRSLAMLISEG